MIELKNCPVCEKSEWENLDRLREQANWYQMDIREEDEPVGFKVCKECGFLTYDYIDGGRLAEHYDRERPVMAAANIITCNRKNEYHKIFLGENIDPLIKPDMNVLDVGCAQGSFLDLCHKYYNVPTHQLFGTEFSHAFSSFGINEYGVNISKEIDMNNKYDFISYYHVLEHIQYPEVELEKIKKVLNDDGYLYLSVPVFLDKLDESGGSMTMSFENLFHLNHVNCFTYQSFQNLLLKHGFEIVKEDKNLYGYTVLCKKSCPGTILKEDYLEVIKTLEKQKKAIELLNQKKHEEALEQEPNYPDAYLTLSLTADNMKSLEKQVEILEKGLKLLPKSTKLLMKLAQVYLQWDENSPDKQFYSNNIKKAEKLLNRAYDLRPGEDVLYFQAIIEAKYKKNFDKAASLLKKTIEINPTKFTESYNMIASIWKDK